MLNNYELLKNGLIKQINIVKKTDYNNEYVDIRYNQYGELNNYMSYLRLGYLLGVIKTIPESILDIGYGNGAFLNVAKNVIRDCYGNDISNYTLPDGVKFKWNKTSQHFDVVTFFDSLEHFEDISFVSKLKCKWVLISVPNCHYGENDEWFLNWKHRREDEHLWHFNKKSLQKFFNEAGFKMIACSNIEDIIRKNINQKESNILTMVFEKKKEYAK